MFIITKKAYINSKKETKIVPNKKKKEILRYLALLKYNILKKRAY